MNFAKLKKYLSNLPRPHLDLVDDRSCAICGDDYLTRQHPEVPVQLPCGCYHGLRCITNLLSSQAYGLDDYCPICDEELINYDDDDGSDPPYGGPSLPNVEYHELSDFVRKTMENITELLHTSRQISAEEAYNIIAMPGVGKRGKQRSTYAVRRFCVRHLLGCDQPEMLAA